MACFLQSDILVDTLGTLIARGESRLSLFYTFLGVALGVILVLLGNPVQMIPRFLRPIRYASAKRVSQRIRSDCSIKQGFWSLSAAALALLLLLFLVSMQVPVADELLPARIVVGLAAGLVPSWWLLRRHEILVSPFGVVGLYPNPRLIVSWSGLSGYSVDENREAVLLLNQRGKAVEALPYSGLQELQELELALRPYLSRLNSLEDDACSLPAHVRRSLHFGFFTLLISVLPIGKCWLSGTKGQMIDDQFLMLAILVALTLPLFVLNWSLRFRLVYYGSLGHVQVVHLKSLCQRCHYQVVCWKSGLHRQIRWQEGRDAVFPPFEQFRAGYRQGLNLSSEVYPVCCQCLLAHLQEQDVYQVDLRPLVDDSEV